MEQNSEQEKWSGELGYAISLTVYCLKMLQLKSHCLFCQKDPHGTFFLGNLSDNSESGFLQEHYYYFIRAVLNYIKQFGQSAFLQYPDII